MERMGKRYYAYRYVRTKVKNIERKTACDGTELSANPSTNGTIGSSKPKKYDFKFLFSKLGRDNILTVKPGFID